MDHKQDYLKYAYLIKDMDGQIIEVIGIKSNEERLEILKKIRTKGYYLYYALVHKDDKTKQHYIKPPYIVDFDSVPSVEESRAISNDNEKLRCKHCLKLFSTTSGLTNHINAKH